MLAYCLCYCPTIALTNSLTLRNIKNAGNEFPLIRVFATLGWIFIGVIVGKLRLETSAIQFLLAAGASVVMALFCLTLPHTPPSDQGKPITVRTVLGLDALVMLKEPSFLIFVIASVLACIPLTFYFSFTNAYLNEVGRTERGGQDDAGAGLRSRRDAADASHLPAVHVEGDSAGRACCVVGPLRPAGLRQRGQPACGCSTSRSCCTASASISSS